MIARGWCRRALSSSISTLSLILGILLSSVLLLFVLNEYSISKAISVDRTFAIEQKDVFVTEASAKTNFLHQSYGSLLRDRYPEIKNLTIFRGSQGMWNDFTEPQIFEIDYDFTDIVNLEVEQGNLKKTIETDGEVALTRSMAHKLVKDGDPLGQTVKNSYKNSQYDKETNSWKTSTIEKVYTITTILKDPVKSPINYSGFCKGDRKSFDDNSQQGNSYGMVKLHDNVSLGELVTKMKNDSTLNEEGDFYLTPIDEVYFSQSTDRSDFYEYRDKNILYIGLTIAFAILLISIFNYINLTLVRAPQRLKNYAGQRIMGASIWGVRAQILADTTFNVLVAVLGVAILMPPSLDTFNSFMNSNLGMSDFFESNNVFYFVALILILILLPSMYLIIKMEILRPLETFMNPNMGRGKVVRTMVIAQFTISVVLIVVGVNIARQVKYITEPLPRMESMIMLTCISDTKEQFRQLNDKIRSQSFIKQISNSNILQFSRNHDNGMITCRSIVDSNFCEFYGIKLLEGRTLDLANKNGITNVVVNEAFVATRELKEPLGYEFEFSGYKLAVVGVCEDVITENARQKVLPTIYMPDNRSDEDYISIALIVDGQMEQRVAELDQLCRSVVGQNPQYIEIKGLSERFRENNEEAVRMEVMVTFFMIVSLILTSLGMFGMSWYTVQGRAKEIALRKIHGATTAKMVVMLCKSFFSWVAIATIIAIPIAYYLTGLWLEGFAYRIENSLWVVCLTIAIIALVTFVTVIWQTHKAASTNPAKVVKRNE